MRNLLLIIGIIGIITGILSLLFAALNRYAYYHALDGSSELYGRLRKRMKLFLVIGLGFVIAGGVCLVVRG